jgi:small conductance mechanosensitive channel
MSDSHDWLVFLLILALRLGGAALVILATRRVAAIVKPRLNPVLARTDLSPSLITLASTATNYGIWLAGIMVALVVLGVSINSVFLVVAGLLVVLGIALQESLRDLAATINFVMFKHFVKGDLIETNGVLGTVQEIELLNTTILKADQRLAILPNGKIQENGLLNYSKIGILRAEIVVGISYEDDIVHAKEIIRQLLAEDARILKDPEPLIVVLELGDSSVNIGVRPFVAADDYWQVGWDMTEAIKLRFDQEDITIPYPQRDVHVKPDSSDRSSVQAEEDKSQTAKPE